MSAIETVSLEDIRCHLGEYIEPHLGTDLLSARSVEHLDFKEGQLQLTLKLGFPCKRYAPILQQSLEQYLQSLAGVLSVEIEMDWQVTPYGQHGNLQPPSNIKNIIAVASGKGGVGKSTVTSNLAVALAAEGARVGVLDADIYGPSQPRMLGGIRKPEDQQSDNKQKPAMSHGVVSMSIGYMVDEELPMIWRGPMITKVLNQLLNETAWPELDYLMIDLPPGTGDVQLSLAQSTPISGAVIVSTPQDLALLDARRGISMFRKVEVSILGIVENMSIHVCSNCGHKEDVFGGGGGQVLADEYGIPLLGQLPLDRRIREYADGGKPIVAAEPYSELSERYLEIARITAARLSLAHEVNAFPDIEFEDI